MKKMNVSNITLNQLNVINAIKANNITAQQIAETTKMPEHTIKSILGTMVKKELLEKNDDDCYSIKNSHIVNPKITLKGDLNFPVTSFIDAEGQRWVTRNIWHKIDENIDIINDIVWEDTQTEQKNEKMKEIIEKAKETEKTKTRKAREPKVKTTEIDKSANPELKKLISKNTNDFININEKWKMRLLSVSATSTELVFSPRVFINEKLEFTHGLLTEPKEFTIEEFEEFRKGKEPIFSEELVKNATSTAFITEMKEDSCNLTVIELKKNGKSIVSEWIFDETGYKRTKSSKIEIDSIEYFEKLGAITREYFNA